MKTTNVQIVESLIEIKKSLSEISTDIDQVRKEIKGIDAKLDIFPWAGSQSAMSWIRGFFRQK